MRVLRVLGVAVITAIVAAVAAIIVSDPLTKLYHVPDMEGQRGMLVAFAIAPLSFIGGFVLGLIVAVVAPKPASFWKAQGWSLALVLVIVSIVAGVLYLAVDKPPRLDGKLLTLEFEIRVPPNLPLPADLNDSSITVSLYTDGAQSRVAYIEPGVIQRDATGVTFTGSVPLLSHAATRQLAPYLGNMDHGGQTIPLSLPPAPGHQNETWSSWTFATEYADATPATGADRMSARYRVQPEH